MLADRQTQRHTDRRVDHNTPHLYRGGVIMDFLTPTVKFIGGNVKEFFNLSLDLSKLLHEQY